jgi:hypothetical protein
VEKQIRFKGEIDLMKERWGSILKNDPFYSPHLTRDCEDFALCGSDMKNQLKNAHFYLMLLGDAFLFAAALTLAYLFRFEFSLDDFFSRQLKAMLIVILPLKLCIFFLFDLYKGMWRYTSTRDFWRLLQASATSTLIIVVYMWRFRPKPATPLKGEMTLDN